MPTLWTFNFDSPCHFLKAEYIFEFEGKKYRLIRGTKEECDKLLTISYDSPPKGNQECIERTIRLLYYIGWQLRVGGMQYLGGSGQSFKEGMLNLETTTVRGFRERKLRGYLADISSIPDVTNNVQIDALALWNEAEISNSPFYAFINYWKILELVPLGTKLKGSPEKRAVDWINKAPTNRIIDLHELKREISETNMTVGEFLWNECRNAIVHITRKPTLNPSRLESYDKIYKPNQAIRGLARYYIERELGLSPYSKPLAISRTKERTMALRHRKEIYKKLRNATKESKNRKRP